MLDSKDLRSNFNEINIRLKKRNKNYELEKFTILDKEHRQLLQEAQLNKAQQNSLTKNVPLLKQKGEDVTNLLEQMKELSDKVTKLETAAKQVEEKIEAFLLSVPNAPSHLVPEGVSEEHNQVMRTFSLPSKFDFEPVPHYELGAKLGILDFEKAAKVTGSRFVFYKGLGARLERSLITLMLDTHTQNGYTELIPPVIVNSNSMIGTGQLPKFEEDMFKITGTDYYLSPTAEVPVTNIHKNEILDGTVLPIKYCAYSPCFRAEAGSAGRDTRGIIRQHQFNKVELVKFTKSEDSYSELEKLTADAESILQMLNIPYRVVRLCGGDLGFSATMTYDIEIWMPSYNRYVEISSCSNFEGFQARRANIRYKNSIKDKAQHVHTLNGSGLAVGRLFAAILENFQQANGSVIIPQALEKYMGINIIEYNRTDCR